MGLILDGYRTTRLLRSAGNGEVWAATRERDQLPVVAKSFAIEDSAGLEARVEHEFELIRGLDCPGVVSALALERSGRKLVLVLEAHGGVNLREYAAGKALAVERFLDIAVQIAEILGEVHQRRVVHRDLKPTNILIDPDSGEIALADFGISVLLESERGRIHERSVIEGTLPYMAPEQTGRTDREVDFRSDLYSLGVTFYELLTGRRPFEGDSPLELIHAHFARRPEPPQRLRPELPSPLSQLVMKLLEKAPERRYQSALGLAADLRQLRERPHQAAGEAFELGREDASTTLQLPHQLYGREAEREQLRAALRRVAEGRPELALILGPSGIGKSALLDEMVEPVIARRGFLARGKFEEESAQPFSGIIEAVSGVADQLLTESSEELASWRARLRATLGGFAPVICELAPRLRAVLGEVEAARPLPPIEARNQVMLAFARLLAELARPEHPLVLALDDLQWADAASVELLESLLADADAALLVVATTRERPGEHGAAGFELLRRLEARELEPTRLTLAPLDRDQLTAMLADLLSRPPEQVAPLAALVARKTGNNPFFVRQFLLLLADLDLLERGPEGWRWDAAAIERAALPEDALAMMSAKLERLDPELRELLCRASVFGNHFDPLLVEQVAGGPSTLGEFQKLAEEGLIAPFAGRGYAFAHDRIREAAYVELGRRRQRALHLAVGEALLEQHGGVEGLRGERGVFEIADHLNRGLGLADPELESVDGEAEDELTASLDDPDRLEQLARVNLLAGKRALASGAPSSSRAYLSIADELLAKLEPFPARRAPRRALHFEVGLGLGEAASLLRDFDGAEAAFADLLGHSLGPEELGRVAVARCSALMLSEQREPAIDYGLGVLRELGVSVPAKVRKRHLLSSVARLAGRAKLETLEAWQRLEPARDPRALAAMDLLSTLGTLTYVNAPETFVVLVERHADLVTKHGQHPSAPLVFTQIALIAANAFGRRVEAVALGERCIELAEAGEATPLDYRCRTTHLFLRLWTERLTVLAELYGKMVDAALEAGDLETADFNWACRVELSTYGGAHLRKIEELAAARIRWAEQWGTEGLTGSADMFAHASQRLIAGPAPAPGERDPLGAEGDNAGSLGVVKVHSGQLITAFVLAIFGRWAEALSLLEGIGDALEQAIPGGWHGPVARVLHGLAAGEIASREDTPAGERRRLRRVLRQCQRTLHGWVEAGGNFAHHETLLRAELAGLDGDLRSAAKLFEEAEALAGEQHNPIFAALACERMAATVLRDGLERFAITPLRDARAHYQRWGAFAKVEALEQRWPALAQREEPRLGRERERGEATSSSTTSKAIDTATVLEASQAIAEDIRLDQVIARVMRLAVENAGAERGLLILAQASGRLGLAAEYGAEDERATLAREPQPLATVGDRLPAQLLRWVARTGEPAVLDDARADLRFAGDPYLSSSGARSVLCLPIVKHGDLIGLIYLENRLSAGAFTAERLEILELLAAQAGSALENARLYDDLRVSEVRWRSLIEQLPDDVAIIDKNGELEAVNTVTDERRRVFLVEEHRDELRGLVDRVFRSGEQQEIELDAAGGEACFVIRIAPITVDGAIERAIVVATDVSERRRAETQRAQLEAQLRQQQRLESIGTLASGVAHEINNPVQGIMNYAELIACSPAADEDIREFAGEIEHETQRVASIVRNLLAFSREEREEPMEETSLREIVEGTLSLIRAVLRKDQIRLDVDLPDDLPRLSCRPQQIQQVVMNLVTNARDALNARFEGFHDDKFIAITGEAVLDEAGEPGGVRLIVEDHGGGVPEEAVARIFDPFFTTKGRDQGTGLGLAVSHGIIADHGGELRLDNRPGEGARFVIELV